MRNLHPPRPQLLAQLHRLRAARLTLTTAGQGDLDAWLTNDDSTHRRQAGHFVRWANKQKLTSLELPASRWGGPTGVIDTETRWEQARRLLNDDTVKPEDRVAGLLVLLYAQWPATISRLTLDHIDMSDEQVRIHLGRQPIVVPEPLAALVVGLVATRRGHATIGDQGTSRWLFPGGQPGRPLSAFQLAERLRQLGLRPGQSRSAALFQLATDLPAALLARHHAAAGETSVRRDYAEPCGPLTAGNVGCARASLITRTASRHNRGVGISRPMRTSA